MKISIVTAHNEEYQPLANITWNQNKKLYAEKYNYDAYVCSLSKYHIKLCGFERIEYVIDLLETGKYDWIWVTGSDVMVTNFTVKLEDIIDNNFDFIITVDCLNINNDSFLVRNAPLSINWLKKVVSMREEYSNAKWYEQSAMIDTIEMMGNRIKILPQRVMNSYDYWQYPQDYQPHIDKKDLFGNSGQWEQGDFVIQWPGLSLQQRLPLAAQTLNLVIQ